MSVFLKAIDIISEHGWTKGKYYRPTDEDTTRFGKVSAGYCLIGACAEARNPADIDKINNFENSYEYSLLARACNNWLPSHYNDRLATTKEDAINVLRKAHEHECELAKQTELSSALPA
jgi:hypothetical protein